MAFSMIVFAMCDIVSESVVQIADKSHYGFDEMIACATFIINA